MKHKKTRGFTLIELMVTVAIVGILAAVAYPSYTQYVVRANRSAVQSFMYSVSNRQEQFMLDARKYGSKTELAMTLPTEVVGKYDWDVVPDMTTTPPSYVITATPQGAQATRDAQCMTLTLNQLGVKTKSGSAASVSDCW